MNSKALQRLREAAETVGTSDRRITWVSVGVLTERRADRETRGTKGFLLRVVGAQQMLHWEDKGKGTSSSFFHFISGHVCAEQSSAAPHQVPQNKKLLAS